MLIFSQVNADEKWQVNISAQFNAVFPEKASEIQTAFLKLVEGACKREYKIKPAPQQQTYVDSDSDEDGSEYRDYVTFLSTTRSEDGKFIYNTWIQNGLLYITSYNLLTGESITKTLYEWDETK